MGKRPRASRIAYSSKVRPPPGSRCRWDRGSRASGLRLIAIADRIADGRQSKCKRCSTAYVPVASIVSFSCRSGLRRARQRIAHFLLFLSPVSATQPSPPNDSHTAVRMTASPGEPGFSKEQRHAPALNAPSLGAPRMRLNGHITSPGTSQCLALQYAP